MPLLVGPREIAKFLDRDPRETDRLIRKGIIPTWKFGSRAAATRESLAAWVASKTEHAEAEHAARSKSADIVGG